MKYKLRIKQSIPVYQLFCSSKILHLYADITISDEGLYLFVTNN